jgi:lipoyl-dependent peroxiredoxin subunit C
MLTVGDKLPEFSLHACIGSEQGKEFTTINNDSFPGKWLVLFFWALDFTPLCPTEIEAFSEQNEAFKSRNAVVLGGSIDSHYVHLGWRNADPRIQSVKFPMLADIKHELSAALGILHNKEGVPLRATFIVDPQGIIRYACTHDLHTGRNVDEVLRTLDAIQTGAACPVNWKKGQKTL